MNKIVFFNIPAHGHTNPTIPVVKALVKSGCEVTYFSFEMFREKIESAGAFFVGCDVFLPQANQDELDKKAGKDFSALIKMVTDTTINMENEVLNQINAISPDCIVSDSVCFWGKLFARKLNILYISSTTTFAFNMYSAKMMKPGIKEIFRMFLGMPRISHSIRRLNKLGYEINSFVDIIQNDNNTNTIVYTSKLFQPMSDTFSDRFAFVGPSLFEPLNNCRKKKSRKLIYISLGTVLNQNDKFYQQCIEALKDSNFDVIMSVGEKTDLKQLETLQENFKIQGRVNQIEVLKDTDCFLTHSGMNSVSESLYWGVPMVLFPQHSEQGIVASQTEKLGAGIRLKRSDPNDIRDAVNQIINQQTYRENAEKIGKSFRTAGGSDAACNFILSKIIT
ncbi:glycosyltransferase [Eubacteriaceae bacterium ES3]|nr:glycosyltransferase [Eubacteriaceae bacterium ES3]